MKRWPSLTLFTAILFGLWLLLNDSVTPGQIALAVFLTVATAASTAKIRPLRAHPHHLQTAVGLFFVVLIDISAPTLLSRGLF